jgi:hypothetical protein
MPRGQKPSRREPENTIQDDRYNPATIALILGNMITLGAAIVGIIWFFFNLPLEVEKLVDKRLKERDVIEKLAKNIRPSMIFDSAKTPLADLGASEYIESVDIVGYFDKEKNVPTRIEVKCKRFLALAPLLTSLDLYTYDQTVERGPGPGFTWIYKLVPDTITSTVRPLRFRLEVLL